MKNYCLFIVTFMGPGSYIAPNRGDKFYHPCLNLGPPLFISSLNSLLFKQLGDLGKSRKKVKGCEVYFLGTFSWTPPLSNRKVPNTVVWTRIDNNENEHF